MTGFTTSALWITGPGDADIQETQVDVAEGEVVIKTLYSGISRGTERLVFAGQVPDTEHDKMRAPFQDGPFTFPVKYGYAAVGEVQTGPRAGEIVFALFPHQARFAVPGSAALTVPEPVSPARAALAANMETALNILWDANPGPGDKVAVVGAGVVGALVGYLAARVPGTEVCLIDTNPDRAAQAEHLGCSFAAPEHAPQDVDLVIHTSATEAGLSTAIHIAGFEATIIEASWYGTRSVSVPLGAAFHQRRLRIVGSQVGHIPASRSARWDFARRLRMALSLLNDPRLDVLIASQSDFRNLAQDYAAILDDPATLCHLVQYSES